MEIGTNLALDELTRGKELVTKLLACDDSNFFDDRCRSLTKEISSSLHKAISILSPAKSRHNKHSDKQRKKVPTSKVRLGSGPEMKGPVNDGYSWRKYGKKHILEAKYPRGYYRCTHGKSQGCPAMKQVQRSDDDPLSFDVTYWGTHTCQQKSPQDLLLSSQTDLKVNTEGLASISQEQVTTFSPYSAASESNNFSTSPCQMSSFGGLNPQTAESEFAKIVNSAATPAINSSELEMEFLLDCMNFDQYLPY